MASKESFIGWDALVEKVRGGLPGVRAVYAFGSRIEGTFRPTSDLDMAVLVAGKADPLMMWSLTGKLMDIAGCPVDLMDLMVASTVMQYRVITTGKRLWYASKLDVDLFECFVLSEKSDLDEARAGLLADIQREGKIYAR